MAVIYINGRFEGEEEARISPLNRGLLYGDGLFETLRGYGGKVFALEDHLERLAISARYLKIPVPFSRDALEEILTGLLKKNGLTGKDSRIRVNLVRGRGRGGLAPESVAEPEVIITAEAVPDGIRRMQEEGIRLVVIRGIRLDHRSPLACHKTFNYIPGIMGLMEVEEKGGAEGLFLNYDGHIVEGVTSNVFMVKEGTLITPPLSDGLLPGITRKTVAAVAKEEGIAVEEKEIREEDLLSAEEIFITGSVREVVPAVSVEGKEFPAGPVTRRIRAAYGRFVKKSLQG